ncbi:ROK family transcriptional regulator [Butyricicoccus sp.]|uniref:ROK family transcriptional regulator n=1 Tax=Butyricicoccus sp. TaxID=2049021 RepID=UPI003F178B1B
MMDVNTGKMQNAARILQLLRTEDSLTKQEVSRSLHLSMPTTLQNINELMDAGILEECGTSESTGGRKAKKIRLRPDAGLGVGIDVALHHIELAVTDLRGCVLAQQRLPLEFHDTPAWYQALSEALEHFLQANQIDTQTILSAGVSFPGIIDGESEVLLRSHIFGLEHIRLDRFHRSIPFPVVVANDANCAGFSELCAERPTYVYVSLNESVGGAFLLEGRLYLGGTWQAGEIGHMLLIPGGERCYCGKHGCADAYLSPKVLRKEGETLASFFRRVEKQEKTACETWDVYLEHLAILLTNLRMMLNTDLVIGGEVGTYIAPYLDELCTKAMKYDLFARDIDYIFPCTHTENAFSAGASMLALERYSSRLLTRIEPDQ